MRTALIAGASGLTGKQCLYQLLENNHYDKVIALVRNTLPLKHPKLQQVIMDYGKPETFAIAADDVFCCLGTTIKKAGSKEQFRLVDYTYPLRLAEQSLAKGARQFVVISALGADATSSIFYNQVKGEMEAALSRLGFESVKILQPSLLLGARNEFRLGERIAQLILRPLGLLFIGPLKKYKPIPALTLAKAMVAVSLNEEKGVRKYENNLLFDLAYAITSGNKPTKS